MVNKAKYLESDFRWQLFLCTLSFTLAISEKRYQKIIVVGN